MVIVEGAGDVSAFKVEKVGLNHALGQVIHPRLTKRLCNAAW